MRLSLTWKLNPLIRICYSNWFFFLKLVKTIDIHQKTVSSSIFSYQIIPWLNKYSVDRFVIGIRFFPFRFCFNFGRCHVRLIFVFEWNVLHWTWPTFVFVYLLEAIYKRIPINSNLKIDVSKAEREKLVHRNHPHEWCTTPLFP